MPSQRQEQTMETTIAAVSVPFEAEITAITPEDEAQLTVPQGQNKISSNSQRYCLCRRLHRTMHSPFPRIYRKQRNEKKVPQQT